MGIKKLQPNRKGNSIFAKNLFNFIDGYWNFNYECDLFREENCVPNDSTYSHSDLKNALNSFMMEVPIMKKPVNWFALHKFNLRNKFDQLSDLVKGSIDILIASERKLDDSFPEGQFLIECFHLPLIFDRNKNGGGIMLYVREDIC